MSLAEPGPAPSLARPALAVELTELLRRMILEGELTAGEKVPERALTQRFGVSRTPLREAVKVLAAEGLVELVPNRGALVARQTMAELAELFPIIAALEGVAGELAAPRASEEELAEVADLTRGLRAAFEARDRPGYFRINQAIHATILAAARNRTLARQHEVIARRLYRARYQANLTPERWLEATREHEAIRAALEARDGARLGRLMKEHMEHKLDVLAVSGATCDGSTASR
jgi:DNA-binding GntR family transcriptional regulator